MIRTYQSYPAMHPCLGFVKFAQAAKGRSEGWMWDALREEVVLQSYRTHTTASSESRNGPDAAVTFLSQRNGVALLSFLGLAHCVLWVEHCTPNIKKGWGVESAAWWRDLTGVAEGEFAWTAEIRNLPDCSLQWPRLQAGIGAGSLTLDDWSAFAEICFPSQNLLWWWCAYCSIEGMRLNVPGSQFPSAQLTHRSINTSSNQWGLLMFSGTVSWLGALPMSGSENTGHTSPSKSL